MNSELIASIGTALMLAAYLLNLYDKLDNNNILYIVMNFVGGALACIASIMIEFIPFIILEGTWSIMSGIAVYKYFKNLFTEHGEDSENS